MIAIPNTRITDGERPLVVTIDTHGNGWLVLQKTNRLSQSLSVVQLPTLKNVVAACVTPDGSTVFLLQMAQRSKGKLLYFGIGDAIACGENTQVGVMNLPFVTKTYDHKSAGFIIRSEGGFIDAYFGVLRTQNSGFTIRRERIA